ncbi:hypothetical protein L218DRAFT_954671 [Marasmius fiardii PR-910]|nr:hypothetical protein L218DRAFT_954671 [Marasmius fiardii PR-910]
MPRGSCSGVTPDYTRCGKEALGRYCNLHEKQFRWLNTGYSVLDGLEAHAKMRLCIGLIKDNSRLCNNRVGAGPFNYCHLHRNQAPPSWDPPKSNAFSGVEVHDTTFDELRKIFLDMVMARERWSNPNQSSFKPSSSSQGQNYSRASESQYNHGSGNTSYTQSTPRSQDDFWNSYSQNAYSSSSNSSTRGRYNKYSFQESYRRQRERERRAEQERREREERERRDREQQARRAAEEEASRRRRAQQNSSRPGYADSTRAGSGYASTRSTGRIPIQTPQAAADHYYYLLTTFEKSSSLKTLLFQSFPWPVLVDHHYVTHNDVTEQAARDFFTQRLSSTTYRAMRKTILKQSRVFWHSDTFIARLPKIKDEEERKHVKETADMVNKVVNDLWDREFK